jgi:hypothetical protein
MLTNCYSINLTCTIHPKLRMRLECAALILAVVTAGQPAWVVEGRLNDPAVTRLLEDNLETLAKCPLPRENSSCSGEGGRVKCGENNCSYDNACSAETAGWVPKYACTSEPETTPNTCPLPSGIAECSDQGGRVKCGDCYYDNACRAEMAGWIPRYACTSMFD